MFHSSVLHTSASTKATPLTWTWFIPHTGDVGLTVGVAITNSGSREISDIFNFRSNSHTLIVVDASVLDREEIASYTFTVIAVDVTGSQTSTAEVTVDILDFNDETPVITNDG